MTSRTIRLPRPRDPLQDKIDARIAARRSTAIERDLANAAAAVNHYRDKIGYRGPTTVSVMAAWAGATEGLVL